jgi:uncharacterized protein
MNCPKFNGAMEKVTVERIEVDRCTQCSGLWFDENELKKLQAIPGSERIDAGKRQPPHEDTARHMRCPACQGATIRMVDVRQPHIWYEQCSVCYGVFFDAGEFSDYKHLTLADVVRDLVTQERK